MGFLSKLFSSTKSGTTPENGIALAASELTQAALEVIDNTPVSAYQRLKKEAAALLDVAKYAEAELVYRQALAENPTAAEAHLNLGYVLKELGQISLAQHSLENAVVLDGNNFDAHLLLAMLFDAQNQPELALHAIEQAVRLEPKSTRACAIYYTLLARRQDFEAIQAHAAAICDSPDNEARVLLAKAEAIANINATGDLKIQLVNKALEFLRRSLALDPLHAPALTSQGFLLLALNQIEQALASFDAAIQANPSDGMLQHTVAEVNRQLGRFDVAMSHLEKAVSLPPDHAPSHKLMGDLHHEFAKYPAAIVCYEKAIAIKPDFVEAHIMLAMAQADSSLTDAALETSRKAMALQPDAPEVYFGSGNVYLALNRYPQAISAFQQALRLRPNYTSALINIGAAYLCLADYPSALKACREAIALDPNQLMAHSNTAYCSSFDGDCAPSDYLLLAKQYGEVARTLAKPYTSWDRLPLEGRALKVGLVSSDLLMHPVGFFLEAVIAYVDTEKVEFHAFSNKVSADPLQASLKSRVKSWTSIMGLPDAEAAKLIYEAELDVLIDLSGHTMGNRLPLFCWRAAPVQATWLGYWASTGVAEIDFILADMHCVPTHNQDQFTEKVCYLPDTRYCFTPPGPLRDLPVGSLPYKKNGFVTFGCYQPMRKLTPQVLAAWAAIQKQVPQSMFLLRGKSFTDPKTQVELMRRLTDAGISTDRVRLVEGVPRRTYLESHREVDIILDSFPYPGGTTTCDALWMGVPTVTLAGNTMLSRQGVGLMACAGLSDWVANTESEYVKIAIEKAAQPKELAAIRQRLRQTVFESPLFNAPGFAVDLQKALWHMVQSSTPS